MTALTVEVLKKIIENIPSDFTVEYNDDTTVAPITDHLILDISGKRIIFKS